MHLRGLKYLFLSFSLQYSRSAWPGNTYWQLLVYISAVTTEFCPYLAPARLNSAMIYYTGDGIGQKLQYYCY